MNSIIAKNLSKIMWLCDYLDYFKVDIYVATEFKLNADFLNVIVQEICIRNQYAHIVMT